MGRVADSGRNALVWFDNCGYGDVYAETQSLSRTSTKFPAAPQGYTEASFEVAEAFEVPLSFIFDPNNHQRHQRQHNGRTRRFFAMPYNDFYIWGATAGMLMNLYRRTHDLI